MKLGSIFILLLVLAACSSSDKEQPQEETLSSEIEKSMMDDPKDQENLTGMDIYEEQEKTQSDLLEQEDMPVKDDIKIADFGNYEVKAGDTLMYISFKIYGDYRKWKSLLRANPGLESEKLAAGQVIKYEMPEVPFNWKPKGLPHLILRGETLGKISKKHYGTMERWTDIYENNSQMIIDKDLIFAGFTLYYIPDKAIGTP
jgi:nucleoid-associated protein YgaU